MSTHPATHPATRPATRRVGPKDVARTLAAGPSLDELRTQFPQEWAAVQLEVATVLAKRDASELAAALTAACAPVGRARDRARPQAEVVSAAVRRHITIEVLRQACTAVATGVTQGSVKFGRVNGTVLQKLLFERGLRRKPVSATAFRLLWPLLPQRRFLMPLVTPQGIYCFYSRPLVRELARLIGGRSCLEIAAGDGTLARFVTDAGAPVTATDDLSWAATRSAEPAGVVRMDAARALREYRPQVVLCSWPPPGNTFERHVFTTGEVELYVLITSRHRFAAGDWQAYEQQSAFTVELDERLSRMVLPPELDAGVYLFRRRVAPTD